MNCQPSDDRFAAFDVVLKRRGRGRWKWSVSPSDGHSLMRGSERSRNAARYKAQRALFLLLCASASRVARFPPGRLGRSHRLSKNARASEL